MHTGAGGSFHNPAFYLEQVATRSSVVVEHMSGFGEVVQQVAQYYQNLCTAFKVEPQTLAGLLFRTLWGLDAPPCPYYALYFV